MRLFKVYGAVEAPHRLLPALVSGLGERERVTMSSGMQVLDFVYIDDVIEAMLRAEAHCHAKGGVATWNVATGKAHSVREFAEQVIVAMNADISLVAFGAIPMRKDDEPWLVGSPELLGTELGWRPSIAIKEGVRAAVAAIRHQGLIVKMSLIDRLEKQMFLSPAARLMWSVMEILLCGRSAASALLRWSTDIVTRWFDFAMQCSKLRSSSAPVNDNRIS